ncbi:hypothetical protein F5884DRAFT_762604 [Xylogone sp. PMI_703]|nr:hypothetical protein F5884DRAFT_762604 [Xylogone sp. PMI_703]
MSAQGSYEMSHIGGHAFNHSTSEDAEREYDRLRDLAREEAAKRSSCFERSKRAYAEGDGALAKKLSDEGKAHAKKMDQYNQQASDFIFRENNAPGRVADDTIDLHGQFVEEAERILEKRIRYAQQSGQTHLHVIVGKGNHSVNHVQKIKPRVEQICQELGLQYATEENAGRMYINLQGGEAVMPPIHDDDDDDRRYGNGHGGQEGEKSRRKHRPRPQESQGQGYSRPHRPQQQQQQGDEMEEVADDLLKKLCGCCTIM